ncbi:hypothetical protein [Tautonia rosea]|uniref:hypothetical protein n=1 Tax=Tautonia rosea TaxID=2728037 RepID=UPI0014729862|nr:hypothetical protein [Tautonia rosea]
MIGMIVSVGLAAIMGGADEPAASHEENTVFASVQEEGLTVGELTIRLDRPRFTDDQSASQQREALRDLAGSDRAVEGLLRSSVTAPFLLSLNDETVDGVTIRSGELFFAIQVDLDTIDPDALFGQSDSEPVEAGNMRFEAQVLDDPDKERIGSTSARFVHSKGRLLDRIGVESTARVSASRSADSVVVASETDRRFDDHERWPNRWWTIDRQGTSESTGPPERYAGGIGYAKLTRLKDDPKTVLVELRFAFAEPTNWFNGAPILRSKFSLIAQDQIRRLRRELNR